MDLSDYDTSALEVLQDELMEEIQELHSQIEEKSVMLDEVVAELSVRFDECEE